MGLERKERFHCIYGRGHNRRRNRARDTDVRDSRLGTAKLGMPMGAALVFR